MPHNVVNNFSKIEKFIGLLCYYATPSQLHCAKNKNHSLMSLPDYYLKIAVTNIYDKFCQKKQAAGGYDDQI